MGRFAGMHKAEDYEGYCSICGEPKRMMVDLLGMRKWCANHNENNCPNVEAVKNGTFNLQERLIEIEKMGLPIRL